MYFRFVCLPHVVPVFFLTVVLDLCNPYFDLKEDKRPQWVGGERQRETFGYDKKRDDSSRETRNHSGIGLRYKDVGDSHTQETTLTSTSTEHRDLGLRIKDLMSQTDRVELSPFN